MNVNNNKIIISIIIVVGVLLGGLFFLLPSQSKENSNENKTPLEKVEVDEENNDEENNDVVKIDEKDVMEELRKLGIEEISSEDMENISSSNFKRLSQYNFENFDSLASNLHAFKDSFSKEELSEIGQEGEILSGYNFTATELNSKTEYRDAIIKDLGYSTNDDQIESILYMIGEYTTVHINILIDG